MDVGFLIFAQIIFISRCLIKLQSLGRSNSWSSWKWVKMNSSFRKTCTTQQMEKIIWSKGLSKAWKIFRLLSRANTKQEQGIKIRARTSPIFSREGTSSKQVQQQSPRQTASWFQVRAKNHTRYNLNTNLSILLYNSLSPSRSSGFRRLNAARPEMGWPVVSDGCFEGRRQGEPGEAGGLSLPPPPKMSIGPGWPPGLCDEARLLNNARGPEPIFTPQADFGRLDIRLTPTW
jgi:hypothetical protein